MEPLELFDEATQWSSANVHHAVEKLDEHTPCDQWNVQELVNHMCDTLRHFAAEARGEESQLDVANPPDLIGRNAGVTYDEYRKDARIAFAAADPDKSAMQIGIAFCDQLIHGWDVAKATGQETEMPDELADAAWKILSGNLPPDKRGDAFKPEQVAQDDSAQAKLLAYVGRET